MLSIIEETITEGGTLRQRIRTSCSRLMRTPDTSAENHSPTGMRIEDEPDRKEAHEDDQYDHSCL